MTAAPAPAAAVETNSAKATAEPPAKAVPVAPKVEEEKKPEKPLPPPPAAKPVSIAAQSEPKKAEQSAKKEEEEDDLPKRVPFSGISCEYLHPRRPLSIAHEFPV